jgi:hypothetical protein
MCLKFTKDEIWENRLGEKFIIVDVRSSGPFPISATNLIDNYTILFTKMGFEVPDFESELDLVKYLGNKKEFPEYFL